MSEKIRLGISSCLLGAKVRYDGGHKFDTYLANVLGEYVEYVPVCPEVEVGLPIPRESLRLQLNDKDEVRLVFTRSGGDMTERMEAWARRRVDQLRQENLDGFVFKSKSPSSGMERVKLYNQKGVPRNIGVGVFARIFLEAFPLLPTEEEGRLHDPRLRENFVAAIFTLKRWRQTMESGLSVGALVDFHSRHKLLLLAHSEKLARQMGQLTGQHRGLSTEELFEAYQALLMQVLKLKTTPKKHAHVMQRILGYFKEQLSSDEKQETLELIERYKNGQLPLIVPLTLLNHFVRKYDQSFLKQQVYLNPHPAELKLLNHV